MANALTVSRSQLIYGLCLPLAVLVGYCLADPMESGSLAVVLLVIAVLSVPILMHWHYPLLILSWNAALNPFFLPGRPYLWMILAVISLFFSLVDRSVDPARRFVRVPSLTFSLLFILAVVLITGAFRGGYGLRTFGSARIGGRGYFYITAAVIGYFALSSRRIPPHRAGLYAGLFFLPALTYLVPNLAFLAGPKLNFLFYLVPPEFADEQAAGDYSVAGDVITRIWGLSPTAFSLFIWLLARYGIRGLVVFSKPWRLLLFLLSVAGCMLSGFRSVLLLFMLVFGVQFCLEKLYRTWLLPILAGITLVAALIILPNAEKLPPVVQRTLSFLPIKVGFEARSSADSSLEWRLQMWSLLLPEIPKYLLCGKGYSIAPADLDATEQGAFGSALQTQMLAGNYHNGPLSTIIPFGLGGIIGFGWFLIAAFRFLYRNYRIGDPALLGINTLLLTYFIAKVLFFMVLFGSFYNDLAVFVGITGLSAGLNGYPKVEDDATSIKTSRHVVNSPVSAYDT